VTAAQPSSPRTVRDLLRMRADDEHVALRFEDESWSWRAHVEASLARAAWLLALRRELAPGAPFHVGVLLDNVPDYSFLLGAAAFAGARLVGINPTRRGAELARDVRHTDCAVIVSEDRHLGLLAGLDTGVPPARIFSIDAPAWSAALAPHAGAAGRDFDWLRVDGENFAAAPVEQILARLPAIELAAVYAVPDPEVGDQCMAALTLRPGAGFDAEAFAAFLAAQRDLGTKQAPRLVRVAERLPSTETNKILKRVLRREGWECADPVWLREAEGRYRRLGPDDAAALRARFRARGRESVLDT
jgi:acyl-CoA synthetase (AMP-forming)/AMP-acid ligase II